MLSQPEFWVAVAFVIFVALAWKAGGFKAMATGLDNRGQRIERELAEAQRLSQEARSLRDEYVRKREEAEKEALAIVASAREEAERATEEAHTRLNEFVARRTAAAEAKIAQAETQATAEVRAAAAEAAIRASELILRDKVKGEVAARLLERSVSDLKRSFG
ncbi:F0F1 ATP synthase subunit B family protein [Chelatococcus reniformis]|uniref:ATP synthase subunit b n=1 Tax=Chelatococcus reniformis TaxID=1494448 RepID=A0A916U6T5_9HYPH|nr:ATP F0F1 synthase subunit B [Chelatococcus reniformis]GGC62750.1 hypothetical protein GCM10010994_21700 [Chelatococcus reniformis]